MKKAKKCSTCNHFADLYFKDGTPAYIGRCRNPKNTRAKTATAGNYPSNICEHYVRRG